MELGHNDHKSLNTADIMDIVLVTFFYFKKDFIIAMSHGSD
jgi:hypothetical protein